MYGSLPNSSQLKVFQTPAKGIRKVVVATNIAETSVTIPGIVYGKFFTDLLHHKTHRVYRVCHYSRILFNL